MQTIPKARSQHRVVTIALVAAIHMAAIYALIITLNPQFLPPSFQGPITVHVVPPQPVPRGPQSFDPTGGFLTPKVPVPPVPRVRTNNSGSTTNPFPSTGAQGSGTGLLLPVYTPARAVAGTHSIPDYPPIAARLNEQGSVRLELRIDEQGIVTDATVLTSSGYRALDQAAVTWVQSHWRYAPALRDGTPIPSSTDAIVTFRLTNRQG